VSSKALAGGMVSAAFIMLDVAGYDAPKNTDG